VRDAALAAEERGWHLVADTSDVPDAPIPTDVMLGYTVLAAEAVDQLPRGSAISHVVVQAGVGGLAAAVTAYVLSSGVLRRPPAIVVVEPEAADCCRRSALAGERVTVPGELQTRMAGLNCGEVSAAAWPILRRGVSAFATISDEEAFASIERFGGGPGWEDGQRGTAGAAGLAAVAALAGTVAGSRLGLDRDAHVLVIRTEG
jgi:diaminopropionate ammonia-lyase